MAYIGLSIGNIFTTDTPEEVFKMYHDCGLNAVDFGLDNFYNPWAVARGSKDGLFEKSWDEIISFFRPYKEAADKYGIAFQQLHAPFPAYVEGYPEMTEHMAKDVTVTAIRLCKYFGSRYIVVHPMFASYDKRWEADEEWEKNIAFYSSLIEEARKADVIVCLENMFTSRARIYEACCADPNEAVAYVEELNTIAGEHRFGFCYDTGHAYLVGHDVYSDLVRLGDVVECLHIHDNDGMGDRHIPAYMGTLDFARFVKGLKAIGYKGAINFEASTVNRMFPKEVRPEAYKLIAATGRYFAKEIGLE